MGVCFPRRAIHDTQVCAVEGDGLAGERAAASSEWGTWPDVVARSLPFGGVSQGEDPATDIRGAGRLGLDCLLYLATYHGSVFSRLLEKLDGERSDWEYPFAVAGLNLTFMLLDMVGLQQSCHGGAAAAGRGSPPQSATRTASGRGFASLAASEDCAFEELFVAAFECLDREWLRQKASYMQFNQVMKDVRGEVDSALSLQPKSVEELRRALRLGD